MNSLGYLVVLPRRQPPIKTDKCLMDVESPLSPSFWLHTCFMSRFPMKDWSLRSFISRGCWRKGGYIKASINASKFPNFLQASVQQQANMNHYFQTLPIMYTAANPNNRGCCNLRMICMAFSKIGVLHDTPQDLPQFCDNSVRGANVDR